MENCAGDWFLLDQEMDKALRFSGYDYSFRIINGGHVAGYYDYFQEAMSYLWKDWPKPVQGRAECPRVRDIILPDETWQLVAQDRHDARGPACNASGEVFFVDAGDNKIYRIDLDGNVKEFLVRRRSCQQSVRRPRRPALRGFEQDREDHALRRVGQRQAWSLKAFAVNICSPPPAAACTSPAMATSRAIPGSVWFVKDGKKTQVDSGLKFATGLAYRPDQWLLSVADGHSKWAYSYQINADGTLTNKERFFWLHVPDWEDDAGAESICYAKEGPMLVATRWGIQVCADDGPTQVILPMPDRSRVIGVCLGGRETGHAVRLLRRQNLETQGEGPRHRRLYPLDPGPWVQAVVVVVRHGTRSQ